jgi:hypothetical protein
MPAINKNRLPRKLHPDIDKMIASSIALEKCLDMKCKIEQEKLKLNKYAIEREKISSKFSDIIKKLLGRYKNDKVKGEIEFQKIILKNKKDTINLEIKIIEEKYRNDFLNCQLKNCYNESLIRLKFSIEGLLFYSEKNSEIYNFASKYKEIFETNKLTIENINNFDIDKQKIELKNAINKFKILDNGYLYLLKIQNRNAFNEI